MSVESSSGEGTRIIIGYNQFLCAEHLVQNERFDLSLFEELNRLIESVVLYDQIVLLGEYRLPSGALTDARLSVESSGSRVTHSTTPSFV